jgi:hypothetical protein
LKPDASVLAADGVSFWPEGRGQHGGLNPNEMEVPLLLHGVSLPTYQSLPAHLAARAVMTLPQTAPVVAAEEENTGIAQALEVSAPVSRSSLQFERGDEKRVMTSAFTPGLEIDWRQIWTDEFSSSLGYGAKFYEFDSSAGATGAHEFRAGTSYRFSSSQNVTLGFSVAQSQWLEEAVWVPELEFGTRQRLFSLGFGDLGARAGLGVLMPAKNFETGFKQSMGLSLEKPVGSANLLGMGLRAEHFSQAASGRSSRAGWEVGLGAYYEMSLGN